jgi:hypothetical protein
MKFIKKGFIYQGKKYHYTFEEEKKIFVLKWEQLTNKRKGNLEGDFETTNIPLMLLMFCISKYSILCIYQRNKIKFIYNPFNLSEIKDIPKEFYDFIVENYDKI